jgi:hypothetical protein
MRKIALALILFQSIGCAKQPVVTTHPEKKQEEETPQHDTPQAPKAHEFTISKQIIASFLLGVAIGALSSFFISRACKVYKQLSLKIRRQKRDEKDSPIIKIWFDKILSHQDFNTIEEDLIAAYGESTDTLIRRLREQPTRNKQLEWVTLFACAREDILEKLPTEEAMLNECNDPIGALSNVEGNKDKYYNWSFWQIYICIQKAASNVRNLRETDADSDTILEASDDLLFYLTEYAYYLEWKETYTNSVKIKPELAED